MAGRSVVISQDKVSYFEESYDLSQSIEILNKRRFLFSASIFNVIFGIVMLNIINQIQIEYKFIQGIGTMLTILNIACNAFVMYLLSRSNIPKDIFIPVMYCALALSIGISLLYFAYLVFDDIITEEDKGLKIYILYLFLASYIIMQGISFSFINPLFERQTYDELIKSV